MKQTFENKKKLKVLSPHYRAQKAGQLLLMSATLLIPAVIHAQDTTTLNDTEQQTAQNKSFQFAIPSQSLRTALTRFGEITNLQLLYDAALTRDKVSRSLSGRYTPEQALKLMLAWTGLQARITASGAVTLDLAPITEMETVVLPEVTVNSSRWLNHLTDTPQAATVITREQIEKQSALTSDLGDILAKHVPGLGTSTEGFTDVGQTLRGRDLFVLIDGVPQTISLRNGQRNLRTIDPAAIERVEVLRGSSSIYGLSGTGGVINIITRKAEDGPAQFHTDVTLGFAPTDISDSLRKRVTQSVSGSHEQFDYTFNASAEKTGLFFDGEGDIIPPDPNGQGGLADATSYNLFGKAGWDIDAQQRLELSSNYYELEQDTNYILQDGITGEQKITAVRGDAGGKNMKMENLQLNLKYSHQDILGSKVSTQVYYRDYMTRFGFFPDPIYPGGGQSFLDSQRTGARLDIETPFSSGRVLWGVDLLHEKTAQPLEDGRFFTPEMEQDTIGPFLQAEYDLTDKLVIHGGARYETIRFKVDDYTTLSGADVEGGKLNYHDTVFNAGVVYYLTDEINTFASFSQGFTVPEIGRILRNIKADSSVDTIRPEPQVVDNYEIGIRGNWSKVQTSLSLFYSESDLGTGLTSPSSPSDPIEVVRAPERIYGVEATVDLQPFEQWATGGTVSWSEGKQDTDDDGSFDTHLLGNRIAPLKATAYIEHQTLPNWHNRLQLLYSGHRDKFEGESGFGKGEVDNYTLLDLISTVQFSKGSLNIGVKNLLDEQYFPVISQMYNFDNRYSAGQGRTVSATYSIDW